MSLMFSKFDLYRISIVIYSVNHEIQMLICSYRYLVQRSEFRVLCFTTQIIHSNLKTYVQNSIMYIKIANKNKWIFNTIEHQFMSILLYVYVSTFIYKDIFKTFAQNYTCFLAQIKCCQQINFGQWIFYTNQKLNVVS